MEAFEHESLEPYTTTLEYVALADRIAVTLPPARAYLADELRRSATAIVGNLAIGASEHDHPEQHRFLEEGRRSAVRCASLLDILQTLGLIGQEQRDAGRAMLLTIVERLSRLESMLAAELAADPPPGGDSND